MTATLAQPTIHSKYATVYDEACTIAQVHGVLWVIYDDRIEPFTVEMSPWTTLLGDCHMSDEQAMWDSIAGGPAAICTHRPMLEV
jgi:hypothetical protein